MVGDPPAPHAVFLRGSSREIFTFSVVTDPFFLSFLFNDASTSISLRDRAGEKPLTDLDVQRQLLSDSSEFTLVGLRTL